LGEEKNNKQQHQPMARVAARNGVGALPRACGVHQRLEWRLLLSAALVGGAHRLIGSRWVSFLIVRWAMLI